jgi:hypothetical protein
MKKVENRSKYDSLSELQKFKMHMIKDNEKVTNKEVQEEFLKIQKKKLTSNFNTTTREEHFNMSKNKTNGPCMGHYQPKKELVMSSVTNVIFHKKHTTAEDQTEKLKRISTESVSPNQKNMKNKICNHLLKSLNNVSIDPMDIYKKNSKSP